MRSVSKVTRVQSFTRAIALPSAFGVRARGTLYVLLLGLRRDLVLGRETRDGLSGMVALGMRIDPGLLTRVMSGIEDRYVQVVIDWTDLHQVT